MKPVTTPMTRRHFLKYVSGCIVGIFALRLKGLWSAAQPPADKPQLKEARHYTRADTLAG